MELTSNSCESPVAYSPPPLSVKLQEKKERLESELKKVNSAIEIMSKNTELSSLFNIVSQLHL